MIAVPFIALLGYIVFLVAALIASVLRRRSLASRARSSAIQYGSSKEPKLVVVLVHGTFAQDAEWTLSGSVLCTEIALKFDGILFHRFRWSGRNTIGARDRAAIDLRREISSLRDAHPKTGQVIIAHSHGGNVALAALGNGPVVDDVGLICLATPVIVSRPRHFDTVAIQLKSVRLFLPFAIWAALCLIFQSNVLLVSIIVVFVTAASILYGRRVLQKTSAILDETYFDNVCSDKVLFIRAPGDEASTVIAAVQGLTWVLSTLIRFPATIAKTGDVQIELWRRKLGVRFLWICAGLFASSLGFFAIGLSNLPYGFGGILIIIGLGLFFLPPLFCVSLFTGGYVALAVGYVVYPVLLIPILLLMLLSGMAIGPEMTAASLAREVTVEACPRGNWQVVMLGDFEPIAAKDLQHSVVYRSEEACDTISDWIASFYAKLSARE